MVRAVRQRPSSFVTRCLSSVKLPLGSIALDLPCGLGRHSKLLIEAGFSVVAIDLDAERVRFVRSFLSSHPGPGTLLRCDSGDAENASLFSMESFDLIVMTDFYSDTALSNIAAAMKPGGYLILETYKGNGGNWHDLPHRLAIRAALSTRFGLLIYDESSVKPLAAGKATVKCLARACSP
jgi:SAM-dependent methyltransferase